MSHFDGLTASLELRIAQARASGNHRVAAQLEAQLNRLHAN